MNNKSKIISSAVFSVAVFALLAAILLSGIFTPDKQYSETENRYLAACPVPTLTNIADGSFMEELEAYLSDQFIYRDKIVSLKTFISRALGKTRINDVYVGKDNRLFEVPSELNSERLSHTLDVMKQFSEKCGIGNQYFLLAPNASYVYTNELPDKLSCADQSEQIKEIYSHLASTISCVDVCMPLKYNSFDKQLYFRTDHHWTADAALLAFEKLAYALSLDFNAGDYEEIVFSNSFNGTLSSSSGIYETTDKLSCYMPYSVQGTYYVQNYSLQEKYSSVFDFSKLDTKNQYEVFFGGNFSRIAIKTENLNEKHLLIFKDSYANSLIPLLIPHFESIVIIDPRYYNENIEYVLQDTEFTHLLYLYNLNTFLEDTSLKDALI